MITLTKSLMLAAVLALAPASSGCILISDTIDPGDAIDAHFSLTWDTIDAPTGRIIDCYDVGADTVRVTSYNLSLADEGYDTAFVDLFDCYARQGVTARVTAGDYAADVDLVRCGFDQGCLTPPTIAGTSLDTHYAPFQTSVFEDGIYDLGHFDFYVNVPLVGVARKAPAVAGSPEVPGLSAR